MATINIQWREHPLLQLQKGKHNSDRASQVNLASGATYNRKTSPQGICLPHRGGTSLSDKVYYGLRRPFTFRRRENTAAYFQQTRKKMPLQPLLESTCRTNCHKLLQMIVVLETKLLAGLPKQAEHSAEHRHGPPQHTADESCQPSESQQFVSVEEQAKTDRHTNRWHKQGARPKITRDIRLSRVSSIAAEASSTPDMAMTRRAKTGVLKHFEDLKLSRSSADHSQQGELTCFHVECASPPNMNGTHTPGQSMSDHRTSHQLQSRHVVDTSHKDTDNATQPQQALLMDTIPAEPCPLSSSQTDCDVLQQLQDSAPKDDFLVNSQESQDNIFQPPETPEPQPRSPDTLSLSPASPLLSFSQKMEELVYAGTRLSHSFAASPQISTKKRRAPQPPKPVGPAHPPPSSRALQPLPQRQSPNPPPSAVGEPKTTDNSSQ
ncbi:hypothetical protein M9458_056311 [Cirrhinus mrigala]|uniref:Uncharacterized protein n=1 Tax=Cirrhinus mrigala TaxID=683832 RepID=A0ABD0MIT1_CIRMR